MALAEEEVQLKIRVPKDRRKRIKAIAAMKGKSMTELLNDLMAEEIEEFDFSEGPRV